MLRRYCFMLTLLRDTNSKSLNAVWIEHPVSTKHVYYFHIFFYAADLSLRTKVRWRLTEKTSRRAETPSPMSLWWALRHGLSAATNLVLGPGWKKPQQLPSVVITHLNNVTEDLRHEREPGKCLGSNRAMLLVLWFLGKKKKGHQREKSRVLS